MIVSKRLYKCVSATTTEDLDYVPANNKTLSFTEFGGNAGIDPDTVASIWWDKGGVDERLLFTTHGDAVHLEVMEKVKGDGTKKVTIKLVNNLEIEECLGCYFKAVEGT